MTVNHECRGTRQLRCSAKFKCQQFNDPVVFLLICAKPRIREGISCFLKNQFYDPRIESAFVGTVIISYFYVLKRHLIIENNLFEIVMGKTYRNNLRSCFLNVQYANLIIIFGY